MRSLWLCIPVVAGVFLACGSFGSDTTEESPDASTDAAPTSEGAAPPDDAKAPSACDLEQPFGSPQELKSNTTLSIETARPVNDAPDDIISAACQATLDSCELYRTNLADLGTGNGKLTALSLANAEDSFPFLHAPSEHVFFARGQIDGGAGTPRRLYVAASTSTVPAPLAIMPLADSDKEPYIVGDTLYFGRLVGTATRIWSAKIDKTGALVDVATEMPLPFQGNLYSPVVSADHEEIFLSVEGNPRFQLKSARRVSGNAYVESSAFSALTADPVLYPVWLSPDRCTLWIVTKATGSTHGRLQVMTRPK